MQKINCTVCSKPGGTIPKYHISNDAVPVMEDVVEMLHEECALIDMARYQARQRVERENA